MTRQDCCRVALTGGPGGGKTTAADLFRRELGDQVVIVPEAATILYTGGFPRSGEVEVRKSTQKAIYHVQRNLEDVQAEHYESRILLCDRGTIDSCVYWPTSPKNFFEELGTSVENELARYNAVVFFETAAVGGISIEGGNPIRNETLEQAIELDHKLKEVWSQHPNFYFIKHEKSFLSKITTALTILSGILHNGHGEHV